jgi:leader peptidase (prepilin peptidase)/N-methyltransferase
VTEISPFLWITVLALYLPHATVLSAIDAGEHRLPNRLVGSLTLWVGFGALVTAALSKTSRPAIGWAFVLAAGCAVLGIGIALLAPALIGMGDAKTAPAVVLMSASLGTEVFLAAMIGIVLLGGVLGGLAWIRTRRADTRFAFGPVLLAGPFLGLLGAPLVIRALGLT